MALIHKRRFLKAGAVAERMGVSTKALERRANDPMDSFPKPIKRYGKNYGVESEVDAYIEAMVEKRDHGHAGGGHTTVAEPRAIPSASLFSPKQRRRTGSSPVASTKKIRLNPSSTRTFSISTKFALA